MGSAGRVILIAMLGWVSLCQADSRLPLALLGDRTLYAARALSEVPLIMVPSGNLALLSNAHISAVSRSQPLVTCSLDKYSLEATPAVRVVLRRPVVVDSPEAALQFPARLAVLHEGLRVSVPVGLLLAPVSGPGPHIVRVMYAVPTSPLSLQYPYYAPYHLPISFRPSYEYSSYAPLVHHSPIIHQSPVIHHGSFGSYPVSTHVIHERPHSPASAQSTTELPPQQQDHLDNLLTGHKKPEKGPLVTVLHFPEELATPGSLFYQPESEDELGNRNPPEAVVPAGIVQSAQPNPSLQPFINSKESPLLQSLRDEAEENKKVIKSASPNSISVEAL